MATGGLKQDSCYGHNDEYFACSTCKSNGKNAEAVSDCSTCHEQLCQSCYDQHQELFGQKRHTIKRYRAGALGIPQSSTVNDNVMCSKHGDQVVTSFCGQHAQLCCTECATLEHRACENKVSLQHVKNENIYSEEAKTLCKDLQQLQHRIRNVKMEKEKMRSSLIDFQKDYQKKIEKRKKMIDALLLAMQRKTEENLNYLYKKRIEQIQNDIDRCDELDRIIIDTEADINKNTGDKDFQNFARIKKGEGTILACREKVLTIAGTCADELIFCPNEQILEYLTDKSELGTFQESMIPTTRCQGARYCKEINVRSANDKHKCDIQGMCQVLDGSIILADHRNRNLKQLNRSYHVVDVCAVPGTPNRVCRVGMRQIAVAMGSGRKVQFATITDKIRLTSAIRMKHKCYGIAFHNDLLYVTNGLDKIFIYDLKDYESGDKWSLVKCLNSERPTSVAIDYSFSVIVKSSKEGNISVLNLNMLDMYLGKEVKVTDSLPKFADNESDGSLQNLDWTRSLTVDVTDSDCNPGKSDVCVDDKGNTFVISRRKETITHFWNGDENASINSFRTEGSMSEALVVDTFQSKLLLQKDNSKRESDAICVYDILYR